MKVKVNTLVSRIAQIIDEKAKASSKDIIDVLSSFMDIQFDKLDDITETQERLRSIFSLYSNNLEGQNNEIKTLLESISNNLDTVLINTQPQPEVVPDEDTVVQDQLQTVIANQEEIQESISSLQDSLSQRQEEPEQTQDRNTETEENASSETSSESRYETIQEQEEERVSERIEHLDNTIVTTTREINKETENLTSEVKSSNESRKSWLSKIWDYLPLIATGIAAAIASAKKLYEFFKSPEGKKWFTDNLESVKKHLSDFWNDTVLPWWDEIAKPFIKDKLQEFAKAQWNKLSEFFDGMIHYLRVNLFPWLNKKKTKESEEWLKNHPDSFWSHADDFESFTTPAGVWLGNKTKEWISGKSEDSTTPRENVQTESSASDSTVNYSQENTYQGEPDQSANQSPIIPPPLGSGATQESGTSVISTNTVINNNIVKVVKQKTYVNYT